MLYTQHSNSETNGNGDVPLFVLTRSMLRAFNDGELTVSMIENVIHSADTGRNGTWTTNWIHRLTPGERTHLRHVQTTMPKRYTNDLHTLLIMYAFGDRSGG